MKSSRRNFLLAGGILAASPALYHWSRAALSPERDARNFEASLARRYANRLRLPGQNGWFTPVPVSAVSALMAVPLAQALRGSRSTPMWVYQAEVAGAVVTNPILIGRPGDEVALRFDNRLPQASIIHWHGFTNDTQNDGSGMVLAKPGGSHEYRWRIRNGAGLNWYHPHPHEKAGEQVWRGLSGLFIVEDDASARLARELDVKFGQTDIPLIIQDRTLERSGAMPYSSNEKRMFHGVKGDDILVNLTRFPMIELPRRWVRLRILNGSNARLYKLAFMQGSTALSFALLGTDGGLLDSPQALQQIFLAPAQRIDIALDLHQAAIGNVWLKTLPFDLMHNEMGVMDMMNQGHVHGARGEGAEEPILRIEVKAHDGANGVLPSQIGPPVASRDGSATRDFLLDHDGDGKWRINGKTFHQAHQAFHVRRGAHEIWRIRNAPESMPHPMHLHGFSFAVLDRENSPAQIQALAGDRMGRSAQDLGRCDTVLVWPGETVRIAVDFSTPFPQAQHYMLHCHNLEHEDLGMMLGFSVGD